VIERGRDDALGPEAARAQLVHAHAGGQRVVAGPDPVAGRRGHDDADPARAARRAAAQLPAHVRHGAAAVRLYALNSDQSKTSSKTFFIVPDTEQNAEVIFESFSFLYNF